MTRIIDINGLQIPYDSFINDVASRVVALLNEAIDDPEYISQRTAFKMFGRRNVERWREQGKVTPCRRPGKVEYRTADLRLLQRTQEDLPIVGS